jgi:hypothetical protein
MRQRSTGWGAFPNAAIWLLTQIDALQTMTIKMPHAVKQVSAEAKAVMFIAGAGRAKAAPVSGGIACKTVVNMRFDTPHRDRGHTAGDLRTAWLHVAAANALEAWIGRYRRRRR